MTSHVHPDFSRFHARLPAFPDAPHEQRGRGELQIRYEDVSQDGRLGARPTTHAIGAALWRDVLERHPLAPTLIGQGIVPILTRLVVATGGGPIGVRAHLHARGAFELVEAIDDAGKPRFRADLWADVTGTAGRTFGPAPEHHGQTIAIGAMWAEHVLTRPFGSPSERTVDRLPEGFGAGRTVRFTPPSEAIALPEGARWLDDAWVTDPAPIVFGLGHTDSNQHVNSLVYPALLEDAALRRLAALGIPTQLFVGRMEMAYRKPSFAGDVLALRVRVYTRPHPTDGEEIQGVVGIFGTPAELDTDRARAFGSVELEP
jgi:hypothetical protein